MVVRTRVVLLVKGIILLNWVLSKLTSALAQESIAMLQTMGEPTTLVIVEQNCHLDACLDNEENTREILSTWHQRNRERDHNVR